MTPRTWLPHPATTPTPRPECPTRRYPNQATARAALRVQPFGGRSLTPTPCTHGQTGWHLTPATADCEPAWTAAPTLAAKRAADDVPTGEYL